MNQPGYQLGYLRFEDSMSFEFNFASDTYANRCAHSIQDAAGELVFGSYDETLTEAEASQCVFELQLMQDMYMDPTFCPPNP